ncbi:MAG: phosphomethylpyrimidine synthase ThiC, partial [Candidatus Omnitrophica bacterium]|nr:phosphomethylpyrimidine synthase ThiC [Candidatus Omnitrophota bacterium]
SESVDAEYIRAGIAAGSIVLPSNISRKISKYCAVGKGLRTKVNANIGSSSGCEDVELEIKKLKAAIDAGADTVMDLSTGENLNKIRTLILKKSEIPVGTVPIYEMVVKKLTDGKDIADITKDNILRCLEDQAKEGVDFFTIHCGVTKEALSKLRAEGRLLDIVSRGGAFITQWIAKTGMENPFYEYYDEILKIAHEYDVTLSLGDGMRPGCIKDATDTAQITELKTLGKLAKRAKKAGVQVMIEGPGHVPIDQIKRNVEMEKSICDNAPFYVLGPIVTDIAPGYDHITGAIGGALAASFGADFLCYVTPSEHLRLPTIDDVKEGVIASRIAAHAADLAKGVKGAIELDNAISLARKKRDWKKQIECAIDAKKAKEYRATSTPMASDVCTMCNKYCSIKLFEEAVSPGKKL